MMALDVTGLLRRGLRSLRGAPQFDDRRYWEERYASGGSSGDGSSGRLADFKARILNDFIAERRIESAIEFGCGDGNQLALLRCARCVGLDVSRTVIGRCAMRFRGDRTKSFFLYDPEAYRDARGVLQADVALSLDVIYHIVTDTLFDLYMTHLCAAARRYLVVYATDEERHETAHVRHRAFSRWIEARGEFRLIQTVANPYLGVGEQHRTPRSSCSSVS